MSIAQTDWVFDNYECKIKFLPVNFICTFFIVIFWIIFDNFKLFSPMLFDFVEREIGGFQHSR